MANNQEVKVLVGKMDRENSPETMDRYDYLEAHNIRSIGNDESDANYLSNLEGTKLITVSLPAGQNRTVGSQRFETVSKAYFVRYNSMGYHQIVEFDYKLSTERVIFENITDSNDIDILNWNANVYFSDIRLVHSRFLILNNGVNEIYTLDLQKFYDSSNEPYEEEDLYLIKRPPLTTPEAEYVNNTSRSTNSLRGNLFQFIYRIGYDDLRESSWSPASRREVPINEQSNGQGQSVSYGNGMVVSLDVDVDYIEKIDIGVRIGNGNWLLMRTVTKEHLEELGADPSTNTEISIDPNSGNLTNLNVTEVYNDVDKKYEFVFYNDGLYPVLDQVEVNNPYDAVPQKAETVEVINGNVLAVGGITEGYDRPELDLVTINVNEYAPNLSSTIVGGTDFDFSHRQDVSSTQSRFYWKGTPKTGDVMHMKFKQKGQVSWQELTYTVTSANQLAGLNNTVSSAYQVFKNTPNPILLGVTSNYMYTGMGSAISFYNLEFYVVRVDIGYLNTQSINTLKTNSSYQLALAYFDKFGRRFPLVTDDRFIVSTKSIAETEGNLPQINWNIQADAPEGAVSYQWLMSENQKYQKSIYLTGKIDPTETTENYIAFEMKSLERFYANEKNSQINYTFTKGDKVVLVHTSTVANSTKSWFKFPFIELDIVDFTIEQDAVTPTDTKYILKVRNTNLLQRGNPPSLNWLANLEVMMELYTPKKRDITTENMVFYEIGEQYPIINGEHSVTSGSIRRGDWYYKGRLYESNVTTNESIAFEVEDPNFSDNYESAYWSAGRARTYNDEQGRLEKKASIRYSDEYIYGSKYNGISRFYLERIYGERGGETTSKYGWIRKLESRDNAIVCIQEFKVSIIPNYKTIVFDNTNAGLVADSGKIFGSVQYRPRNYGCGTAKQSIAVSRDQVIYFFDDNNCVPVRDSLSGIDVIDNNMSSYFIKHTKEAKDRGARFIGYVDDLAREYNLTIEDVSGRLTSLYFNTDTTEYEDLIPALADITIGQPAHGIIVQESGYNYRYTPDTNYIGSDLGTASFNGKTKNLPITVSVGDNTPDPFGFTNLTNQPLATLVASSVIVVSGINMASPISVVGGEYQINSGAWTTVAGTVNNGDSVRVRHVTSGTESTTTTTTLTIGGVSSSFSTETVPVDTSTAPFEVWATATVQDGTMRWTLNISHALTVPYSISGFLAYRQFGTPQATPWIKATVPVGEVTVNVDTEVPISFPDIITAGYLVLSTSSLPQGSLVVTADTEQRVVQIDPDMSVVS